MTAFHIRPFLATDYSAFTQLKNAVYPEYGMAEEMVRHKDVNKDPRCLSQRFLAVQDGRVIGAGEFFQNPWTYAPRKFNVDFQVLPAFRRRGVGRALFNQVMEAVAGHKPQELWSQTREDKEGGLFLSTFGFQAVEEEWEYKLDPAGFDFTPYAGLEERLAEQSIHIFSMAYLMDHDPAHKEKLYALDTGDGPDEAQEVTTPDFDFFIQSTFDPLIFLPDAFFVAVQDGRYLGMSNLESMGSADKLEVGYTGVDPAFRRRGIALALKLRTIQYAIARGNLSLITSSMRNNRAMLMLNERLGFVRQPAWIRYKKELLTS